jgi:hypothetical protein
MELVQTGTEETAGFIEGLYAPLDKKLCQNPVYPKFRSQPGRLFFISSRFQCPLFVRFGHSLTKITNPVYNCKDTTGNFPFIYCHFLFFSGSGLDRRRSPA